VNAQQLLDDVLGREPDRTAIQSADGTSLTYGELDALTADLAGELTTRTPMSGRVYVLGHHTVEALTVALAALRSGLIYTPMNPELPRERLLRLVEQLGGGLVVAADARWERPNQLALHTDWMQAATLRAGVDVALVPPPQPPGADARLHSTVHETAYSILTSGTTGEPKVVNVGHEGLLNLCRGQAETFGLKPGSRVLQFASLSFDASIAEILVTLHAGATLCLPAARTGSWLSSVSDFLRHEHVDLATIPPSVYRRLGSAAQANIAVVAFVGEALPLADYERACAVSRVFNAYGPTETTVCATAGELTEYSATIGRALPGFTVHVLPTAEPTTPADEGTGELVVVGAGVALGYEGNPGSDRFGTRNGQRSYRTGDLVRLAADGGVTYLGRIDDQFKRLGHRVSVHELESRWSASAEFSAACVLLDDQVLLVHDAADQPDLLRGLRADLAPWEAPDKVVQVDTLPMQVSGKLDREALAALVAHATTTADQPDTSEPANSPTAGLITTPAGTTDDVATIVSALAEKVLEFQPDATTSIFDQGASSLQFIALQVELEERYGEQVVERVLEAMDFDFVVVDAVRLLQSELPDTTAETTAPTGTDLTERSSEARSFAWAAEILADFEQTLPTVAAHAEPSDRVVLTGAGGFVGGHLLRRLADTDRPLTVLTTRSTSALRAEHAQRFDQGLARVEMHDHHRENHDAPVELSGVTLVLVGYTVNHALPLTSQHTRNIAPLLELVAGAARSGARRVVFLSATSCGADFTPWSESSWRACTDPYSQSKLICEEALRRAQARGLDVIILRAPLIFGHEHGDAANLTQNRFAALLAASRQVGALPPMTGAFTVSTVDSIVDALMSATDTDHGTEALLGDGEVSGPSLRAALNPRLGELDVAEWAEKVAASDAMTPPMLALVRNSLPLLGDQPEVLHDASNLLRSALEVWEAAL